MLLSHYDYNDNQRGNVINLLPLSSIINYANQNDMWIVEAYHKKPVTNFDTIKDTEVCNWFSPYYPEPFKSYLFNDCDIILTGGYRSLCTRHFYNCLSINNNIIINPNWIVSDPDYALDYKIFPFWEYPKENLIT